MRRLLPHSLLSPGLIVAVVALVVAASGVSYAAGKITGKQIAKNTITSKNLKNDTVKDKDVKAGSIRSTSIRYTCPPGEVPTLGACLDLDSAGPTSLTGAYAACDARGGRLPTLGELGYLVTLPGLTWANGVNNQYEFSSTTTTVTPIEATARDFGGNLLVPADASNLWYHCLTTPLAR